MTNDKLNRRKELVAPLGTCPRRDLKLAISSPRITHYRILAIWRTADPPNQRQTRMLFVLNTDDL